MKTELKHLQEQFWQLQEELYLTFGPCARECAYCGLWIEPGQTQRPDVSQGWLNGKNYHVECYDKSKETPKTL